MTRSVKILFTGDVCIQRGIHLTVSDELKKIAQNCDLICSNLEGPITTTSVPAIKKGPNIKQVTNSIELFSNENLIVTLANNHIMDYGRDGLRETLKALKKRHIRFTGAGFNYSEASQNFIYEKDNKKITFISVAEGGFGMTNPESNCPGYYWLLDPDLYKRINEAHSTSEKVVVCCHGGAEEFKIPLPEYRNIYKHLIDAGADAVIAHHPHVVQGMEEYKGKPIFYSLGNFAFIRPDGSVYNPEGAVVVLELPLGKEDIYYQIFGTKVENANVVIDNTGSLQIKERSFLLYNDALYQNEIDEYCLLSWEKIYKSYYSLAAGVNPNKRLLSSIKLFLKPDKIFDDGWIMHNLMIDTHYWICRRAMLLKEANFHQ